MNVYEAMGRIVDYAISYLDIVPDTAASNEDVATIAQLLDAYAELAPDWSRAPEWAQFYAVVPGGKAFWSEADLEILPEGDGWRDKDEIGLWSLAGLVDLPLGIDWRLCKWSREAA